MKFGPSYDAKLDERRLNLQRERIRVCLLGTKKWHLLSEICEELERRHKCRFPEASVSAQGRHLSRPEHGSHIWEKQRRGGDGPWEYRLRAPQMMPAQQTSFSSDDSMQAKGDVA